MTIKNKENEFPALTGIRFLAVSMIFLHHYCDSISKGFLHAIFKQLYLGVELFFVLSGFLICFKYYDAAVLNRGFLRAFFIKRFARVYPLFFLLTTFTFIYSYWEGNRDHWWALYFLNITFIKGFSSHFYFTGIYPAWSLTVEETFYILAPLIFLVHKKRNVLFSQVLFFYAVGALLILVFTLAPFYGFFKDFRFVAMATFFGRCFEFFMGIGLALFIKNKVLTKESARNTVMGFKGYTYVGLVGLMVVIVAQAWFFPGTPDPNGSYLLKLLLSNVLFPVFVAFLLYGLIRENSVVQRFFSGGLLQLLGKSSYAFFLVHTTVLAWWVYVYIIPGSYAGLYVGAYLISIILFFVVEQPLRNVINKTI